jgi:ATP-dependent RNA helicase UAP56/SUB2
MVDAKHNKDELPDYEDYVLQDDDAAQNGNATAAAKPTAYTGVHTTSFKDMGLKSELLHSITDCGFEHPSEVQQRCIPEALTNNDVLCQAVSGMGKTAVFVLSILHTMPEDPKPCSAMILCHTRELAYQITEVIYGGEPMENNIKLFKGLNAPHIVVGTPGRILALTKAGHIPVANMKTFVLDECDKLLDQISKSFKRRG